MDNDGPHPPGDVLQSWLRTVLDAAMDAVIIVDHRGRVVSWNPAAVVMFQRTPDEVLGRDVASLIIPKELRQRHYDALAASEIGRPGSILGRRLEVVGQRKDGSTFPVELTITRTDRGDEVLYTGYLRDITGRVQLMDDLQQSKARLVEVSDQTRRDVERDLHDGAQQQLVGLAMLVTQARASLRTEPDASDALLGSMSDVLVATISEIRELARGLLPAVLAEHGVAPALAELGRRCPIPVDIVIEEPALGSADGHTIGFGRWPPTVETTLYFMVAEALTNAAKHGAHNTRVRLRLQDVDPADMSVDVLAAAGGRVDIICQVSDDGPGEADLTRGSGLVGLVDRVSAVGGRLDIDSPSGGGTTLTARIRTERVR